jgi:phosphoribosyl-AMP cyclohydrolase
MQKHIKTIDTKKVTFIADQNKGFGQKERKAAIFDLIDIKNDCDNDTVNSGETRRSLLS